MCFFKVCGYENIRFLKQPPEVLCKKGVLTNFTKFTGKHLCQSLFFNKVAGLRIPVNFVRFLRTPFYTEHLWWLLLYLEDSVFVLLSSCIYFWSPRIYSFFMLVIFIGIKLHKALKSDQLMLLINSTDPLL